MTSKTLPQLPAAAPLDGSELMYGVQQGSAVKVTVAQVTKVSTDNATAAAASATAAHTSEVNAANSAADALASKNAAATSEGNALSYKNAAATSESNSLAYKNAAAASQGTASTSENNSNVQAGNATQQSLTAGNYNLTAVAAAAQAATSAANVSSVSTQDLTGVNAAALHRSPNAIVATFVGNCGQDSDGGAWRKKCASLSYISQETLNGTYIAPAVTNQSGINSELMARSLGGTLGTELVTTGSSDATGWLTNGATVSSTGTALRVTNTAGFGTAQRQITTVVGQAYALVFQRVKDGRGGAGATLQSSVTVGNTIGSASIVNQAGGSGVNSTQIFVFVATATTTYVGIGPNSSTAGDSIDFNNVSIRQINAFAASGSYYPDAATGKFFKLNQNLIAWSQDFTQATPWAKTHASVPGALYTAPDGTNTANKLIEDTTASTSHLVQHTAGGMSPTYSVMTFSVYLKAGERSRGSLGTLGSDWNAAFDLGAGTVTPSVGTATITNVGNGWYRITCTSAAAMKNAYTPFIQLADNTGNVTYTGDGASGLYVWGAQLEYGSTAGTYSVKTSVDYGTTEVFRGNTSEFPEQYALVAEATRLVIYALDQPGRPMWMVFAVPSGSVPSIYGRSQFWNFKSLVYLNGELILGSTSNSGAAETLLRVNFARDTFDLYTSTGASSGRANVNIANRNSSNVAFTGSYPALANTTANAVAACVMSDAPVDQVTGLQVPTIAVATNGGWSVIKQDGTVVSVTGSAITDVGFDYRRRLIVTGSAGGVYSIRLMATDFQTIEASYSNPTYRTAPVVAGVTGAVSRGVPAGKILLTGPQNSGTMNVISAILPNPMTQGSGAVAYISNSYNTGWQFGDIRRCLMADTDAGVVDGTEQVTSPTFASSTGWTFGMVGSATAASIGANQLNVPRVNNSNYSYAYQTINTVIGKTYTVFLSTGAAGLIVRYGTGVLDATYGNSQPSANLTAVPFTFTATASTLTITIFASGDNATGVCTLCSATQRIIDRSYKGAYPNIIGTLTKTPVASAAQLVAYSGFSGSNYVRDAYSSDLDFGTSAWRIGAWVSIPATSASGQGATNGYYQILPLSSFGVYQNITLAMNGANWFKGTGWTCPTANSFQCDGTQTGQSDLSWGTGAGQGTPSTNRVRKWTITITAITGTISAYTNNGSPMSITATGTYVGIGQLNTVTAILRASAGATVTGTLQVDELEDAPIVRRSCGTGPNWGLAVNAWGNLIGSVYDGITTTQVVSTPVYAGAGFIKSILEYTTDGKLTIKVNGIAAASTAGTTLLSLNSRWNQLLWTEDFTNAAWNKQNVTVATTDDPFGGSKAFRATVTATNPAVVQSGLPALGSGKVRVYVRGGSITSTDITIYESGNYRGSAAQIISGPGSVALTGGMARVTGLSTTQWTLVELSLTGSTGGYLYLYVSAAGSGVTTGTIDYAFPLASTGNTMYQRVGAATDFDYQSPMTIGQNYALSAPFPGSICLVRPTATVPSADQSVWMYQQESRMFNPGALITLPDTGNLVDLDYDPTEDAWKTATAGYESKFSGLIRISSSAVSVGSFTKVSHKNQVKLLTRSSTNPGVDVTVLAYNLKEEFKRQAETATAAAREQRVFDFDAVTSQTDFILPDGWTAVEVISAGSLKREGSTKDYTRLFDGFAETIRFGVAPGAAVWVQITARRV